MHERCRAQCLWLQKEPGEPLRPRVWVHSWHWVHRVVGSWYPGNGVVVHGADPCGTPWHTSGSPKWLNSLKFTEIKVSFSVFKKCHFLKKCIKFCPMAPLLFTNVAPQRHTVFDHFSEPLKINKNTEILVFGHGRIISNLLKTRFCRKITENTEFHGFSRVFRVFVFTRGPNSRTSFDLNGSINTD